MRKGAYLNGAFKRENLKKFYKFLNFSGDRDWNDLDYKTKNLQRKN